MQRVSSPAPAIALGGVTKYFTRQIPVSLFKKEITRVTALDDVSFTVQKGEFVAYAGPNGAGKSTTFKLLAGMLAPQKGEVRAMGLCPTKDRVALMRQTGVLFGNRSELWWDHPVRASFEWKKCVWNVPDDTYEKMLGLATDLLDLKEILPVFARELSLGQRMRANLGLMLMHRPSLVLLDEPTLGLDVLAKRQIIEFLKRLNAEEGVTILVTSHDMDDLKDMAQRIVLIHRGAIAFDGDYDALLNVTGDRRIVRIACQGEKAPAVSGARLTGQEHGRFVYEYDAETTPVAQLLSSVAAIPGVTDVETARAPIETVIAELYARWQRQ